jgi:2-hydroxy-3-keto-5-methylthiopentenyl-1-phosphate phosphatase
VSVTNPRSLHIFCDFDGTIACDDLGDAVFVEFGRFAEIHAQLQQGEMTVAQYWRAVCGTLQSGLTLEAIRRWALKQPADPYFGSFALFCGEQGIPLTVVSDGFGTYIHAVLEREGALPYIGAVFCNEFREVRSGNAEMEDNSGTRHRSHSATHLESTIEPVFWGANESCSCFCASCKRNALLRSAAPDALIVYVGDGYSDFCAAEHADIIFAKKALAAHCNAQRIPHYPYTTFNDVTTILRGLIQRKRLKPRHQAVLRRKAAFEVE